MNRTPLPHSWQIQRGLASFPSLWLSVAVTKAQQMGGGREFPGEPQAGGRGSAHGRRCSVCHVFGTPSPESVTKHIIPIPKSTPRAARPPIRVCQEFSSPRWWGNGSFVFWAQSPSSGSIRGKTWMLQMKSKEGRGQVLQEGHKIPFPEGNKQS